MNRKRITVILAAIFYISAVCAQDFAHHRIYFHYGMGYANSMYDKIDNSFIHQNYALGSVVEFKYACFFTPKWGVGLGIGLSQFAAKGTLNIEGVIPRYNDPAYDSSGQRYYDLRYQTDNLTEKQRIWALEIPLQIHYEHHLTGQHGLFAGLGIKGSLPVISAQSRFPQSEGTLTISGYDAFTNTLYTDPPHFGTQHVRTTPATLKLRSSVDIIGDVGWIFGICPAFDLYAGVYGSYGFIDILPKAGDKKDFITPDHNSRVAVNSLLASNFLSEYNQYIKDNQLNWKTAGEKWNRLTIGIKIGIHFKIRN